MTDREIMQQALEAMEEINKLSIGENAICLPAEIDGAMDALRERLAQPEQEHIIDCPRCGHCCPAESIAAAERERIIAKNAPVIEKINVHIKTLEEAVAAERERCAEICDSIAANAVLGTANECARAIRNRSDDGKQ